MKKFFIICSLVCLWSRVAAQDEEPIVNLDLLRAASVPAYSLIGIAPTVIDRPTDLNDLRASLQNATGNYTQLPTNFALEFAPANIFHWGGQTLEDFDSMDIRIVIPQSLSVSVAFRQLEKEERFSWDSLGRTRAGIGFKCSLIRPKFSGRMRQFVQNIYAAQRMLLDVKEEAIAQDHEIRTLDDLVKANELDDFISESVRERRRDSLNAEIEQRETEVLDTASYQIQLTKLTKAAADFKVERKGFFLDFAGGVALDFPANRLQGIQLSSVGCWLTGGVDAASSGASYLGIARYLYHPLEAWTDSAATYFGNYSTLDVGGRCLLTRMDGHFELGLEGVYRMTIRERFTQDTWRYTFNAAYDIGKNRRFTLALGKDFDGITNKGGNLIVLINLIAGFGGGKAL